MVIQTVSGMQNWLPRILKMCTNSPNCEYYDGFSCFYEYFDIFRPSFVGILGPIHQICEYNDLKMCTKYSRNLQVASPGYVVHEGSSHLVPYMKGAMTIVSKSLLFMQALEEVTEKISCFLYNPRLEKSSRKVLQVLVEQQTYT